MYGFWGKDGGVVGVVWGVCGWFVDGVLDNVEGI